LLRLINKRNGPIALRVELVNPPKGALLSAGADELPLDPLKEDLHSLVVTIPREQFNGPLDLKVRVFTPDGRFRIERKVSFLGPLL
jgi:hypothetical protein